MNQTKTPGKTLEQLVNLLGAESVRGQSDLRITGLTELGTHAPDKIAFYSSARYAGKLAQTSCAAVLTADKLLADAKQHLPAEVSILVARSRPLPATVLQLLEIFTPVAHPLSGEKEFSEHALIGKGTKFGKGLVIGRAVIGKDCRLGDNCHIASGACIGDGVVMGDNCVIYPNVVVYAGTQLGNRVVAHAGSVLGGDGFGYTDESAGNKRVKKPHLGCLVIEDDVEVGANSCIDRALLHETRIGAGSKIDNLVQIAHNVVIGKRVVICAQVGIAGSTRIDDDTIIAGQSGVTDHLHVGKRNLIYVGSMVIGNTEDDAHLFGYPAREKNKALREAGIIRRLPEIMRRLVSLERIDEKSNEKTDKKAGKK